MCSCSDHAPTDVSCLGSGKEATALASSQYLIPVFLLTDCKGTWSLPGGHLEFGETFEQCAKREVAEETGQDIEDVEFITATETMFVAENKHYVTVFVSAFARLSPNGEPQEPQVSGNTLAASSEECELISNNIRTVLISLQLAARA